MEYGADRWWENLPTTLEVAAIIPEEDEEISYCDIMEGQHKYHRQLSLLHAHQVPSLSTLLVTRYNS